nr:Ig-like domain-containing protein [Motilibacter deserti]
MVSNTKHGGVIPLTKAEYDRVRAADVVSAQPVSAVTLAGAQPQLPSTVTVNISDGTTQQRPVAWGAVDTSTTGVVQVTGTVQGDSFADEKNAVANGGTLTPPPGGRSLYVSDPPTATATVDVRPLTAIRSVDVTAPARTSYAVGDPLDLTGLSVHATLDDGTVVDVTGSVRTTGYDPTRAGTQTVRAVLGDRALGTFTVAVQLTANALAALQASVAPVLSAPTVASSYARDISSALQRSQAAVLAQDADAALRALRDVQLHIALAPSSKVGDEARRQLGDELASRVTEPATLGLVTRIGSLRRSGALAASAVRDLEGTLSSLWAADTRGDDRAVKTKLEALRRVVSSLKPSTVSPDERAALVAAIDELLAGR